MTDPAPAAKPDTAPRRSPGGAAIWLSAILLLVLALVGTSPYWAPPLETLLPWGSAAGARPEALSARLDAAEQLLAAVRSGKGQDLSDRVTALERRPAADPSADLAPLRDELRQLAARLDDSDAKLAALVKDETTRGDSALRVLIVALADLGNAVASSGEFAAPLASVEALGQTRPGWAAALRSLEASARTGIPGTAVLAQRFSQTISPAILRANAAAPPPGTSFGEAVLAKLRALVVIRRTDGAAGSSDPVSAAVATAETALGQGDLAGAVAALSDLDGTAGQAAAAWLAQARQRLAAEETIARLTQELSSDLAAGTGGG